MNILELFLSKKMSEGEIYSEISKKLGVNIDSAEKLESAVSNNVNINIYVSNDNTTNELINQIIEILSQCEKNLENVSVNVKTEEFLNVCDENGESTTISKPRSIVHRDGDLHATVHIWIVKRTDTGVYVLVQKRSSLKDLHPNCYDVSAAGHIIAGDNARYSAIKEVGEELGLTILPTQLEFIGTIKTEYKDENHIDNEISTVYVYSEPVDINNLKLKKEETESVLWSDIDECIARINDDSFINCIQVKELLKLKKILL